MVFNEHTTERQIILIAHNIRSSHNVGSLLRTADGLGVKQVILSGYTPYPRVPHELPAAESYDDRLPHIAVKVHAQIAKTALGAETSVDWQHIVDILPVITALRAASWQVMAVEQTPDSLALPEFEPAAKIALIVGREVEGIEPELIAACDGCIEIPMFGSKESFNVAQAAAMSLYHCRFQK